MKLFKQTLFLITLSFLMTSCASILNRPHKKIFIHTTEPSIIINNQDTTWTINNRAKIKVLRQKDSLRLIVATNSLTRSVPIKSKNSSTYWLNIAFNYGIGLLAERSHPKRFTYPRHIYLVSSDTTKRYYLNRQSDNKGELHLHISVPFLNIYNLVPANEDIISQAGSWGLSVGLDYYYKKNRFVNLSLSHAGSYFPIPRASDKARKNEIMRSNYLSFSFNHFLSNNLKRNRFSIGLGLSYTIDTWDYRFYHIFGSQPKERGPVKKSHHAIGLVVPLYIQKGDEFHYGVVYRPTYFRPGLENKFVYEFLLSFEFVWKIKMNDQLKLAQDLRRWF